jgi:molecular chaperone DnaK
MAKDKATNNEQKITITSSSGLSKEEVDKMARDAESHAADDRRKKDEIEARNRADAMVYNVDKMLKEHRSKISDEDARNVEAALEETRKVLNEDGSVEKINEATDKLTAASHKLAEAMYKSATPGAGAEGAAPGAAGAEQPGGESKPKDNVVDAEFVDVDENKK